ncbi:DUF541 domain-containing protein [Bordetella sp. 02P26C-1]|nr:SIMPL domain-containing protein [Bordetella sp. 02P26C-1]MVW79148.1 DUF541 domain-containing protein [Bordetella sp. 02P26C-1]
MMHSLRVSSLNRAAAMCCLVLSMAVAPSAFAQSPQASSVAQSAGTTAAPELSLQASASMEVSQDVVRITLAAEFDAESQAQATSALSTVLDEAVKRTDGANGVQVHTGGYNVWPYTDDKGKIQNWRARGEITLESQDFAAASALASKLSDKVAISQIAFTLSRQAREAAEEKLLKQAADAFRARAEAAAQAFGYQSYQLQQLELSGGGVSMPGPRPMQAMAKASLDSAPDVPLQADDVTVSLSVSGKVSLR